MSTHLDLDRVNRVNEQLEKIFTFAECLDCAGASDNQLSDEALLYLSHRIMDSVTEIYQVETSAKVP
jgi:hypothetical protein